MKAPSLQRLMWGITAFYGLLQEITWAIFSGTHPISQQPRCSCDPWPHNAAVGQFLWSWSQWQGLTWLIALIMKIDWSVWVPFIFAPSPHWSLFSVPGQMFVCIRSLSVCNVKQSWGLSVPLTLLFHLRHALVPSVIPQNQPPHTHTPTHPHTCT